MSQAYFGVILLAGVLGQVPTLDAPEFAKPAQEKTILATVRIVNAKKDILGSGVLIGKSGSVAYVLTAAHLADQVETLEVHVFSSKSYPKAQHVHEAVPVIARRKENNQDLALLRIADYAGEADGLEIAPSVTLPKGKTLAAFSAGCGDLNRPTLQTQSIEGTVLARRPVELTAARFWRGARKPIRGESGGPLVNSRGQLLGICSGAHAEQGYYCHRDDIHDFLRANGLALLLKKGP